MANRPRGFQARVAREADLTTDQFNKSLKGTRGISDDEGQKIRDAIALVERETRQDRPLAQNEAPEGSVVIQRIIGNKPSATRPAELVFLLTDGRYLDFQLDPPRLGELQDAVREMTGK